MTMSRAYAGVAAGLREVFPVEPGIPDQMTRVLEKISTHSRLDGKVLVGSLRIERGFWYLASPYAKWGDFEQAFQHAAAIAGRCLKQGVFVFSPISHCHPISEYGMGECSNHDVWMPLDKQFVDASFGIIVAGFPGWDESRGIGMEVQWAKEQGKSVWLMSPEDLSITPL